MRDASGPLPGPLRDAARDAVDRGLGFLDASLRAGGERPDGAWPSRMYRNLALEGPAHEELAPFVAALGALTLAACRDGRSRSIQSRTGAFIVRAMRYPGLWRYWPSLPQDLDSLSVCSQAVAWHPWVLFGRNLGPLRTARDDRGRFRTWLSPPGGGDGLDVDSVVNANVVGYIALQGRNDLGAGAAAWLAGLVREGSGAGKLPLLSRRPGPLRRRRPRPPPGRARVAGPRRSARGPDPRPARAGRRVRRHVADRALPLRPAPAGRRAGGRSAVGHESSASCGGSGPTEAGRRTSSGAGRCRRARRRSVSHPKCSTPLRASRPWFARSPPRRTPRRRRSRRTNSAARHPAAGRRPVESDRPAQPPDDSGAA